MKSNFVCPLYIIKVLSLKYGYKGLLGWDNHLRVSSERGSRWTSTRHMIYVSKKVDFLDVFTEITTSAILVENKKVVAIIDFNFFSNKLINILTNECSILYTARGILERGKENSGGDMVVFLLRNCYAEGFSIYKQTNRKGREKI